MEELVYFELNNWTPDEDYPDKPQFTKWVGNALTDSDNNKDWKKDTFCDDEYAKKNELVISFGLVLICRLTFVLWLKNLGSRKTAHHYWVKIVDF